MIQPLIIPFFIMILDQKIIIELLEILHIMNEEQEDEDLQKVLGLLHQLKWKQENELD